jgi:hypothetical protein
LSYRAIIFRFLDINNNVISTFTKGPGSYDEAYTVPANTKKIQLSPYCTAGDGYIVDTQWFLYEITPQ